MTPQPQAIRPQEAEEPTSAATAVQQSQVDSSTAAEQVKTPATPAAQLPQAAPGSDAGQASDSTTAANTCHKDEPLPLYFKLLLAVVIGSWLVLLGWELFSTDLDWKSLASLGTFGDSFGALNTLFSGLAFLGIIISIKLQRDDLKLQREELAMQRKEITFQRKAIEIQAQEAQHQSEEMQSQRELAQQYQDERFFVLLLEQIKGYAVLNRFDEIRTKIFLCYSQGSIRRISDKSDKYTSEIKRLIISLYLDINNDNQEPVHIAITIFLDNIAETDEDFQLLFDRATQLYEFIMSLSDEKIRTNYARIAYNNIGQYDRVILFMYLVAKLHLRKGDILGDLLFTDYEKLYRI